MHLRLAGWEICLWWPQSICCCTCLMCHFELHMLEKEKNGKKKCVCDTTQSCNQLPLGRSACFCEGAFVVLGLVSKKGPEKSEGNVAQRPQLTTHWPPLPPRPACLSACAQPGCLFVFAVILGFSEADIKHTEVDLGTTKAVLAAPSLPMTSPLCRS